MPEEAQQTSQPDAQPAKRTAVQAAQEALERATAAQQNANAALRVAEGADDMAAAMSEKVTDLSQRMSDVVTRDQVDGRLLEALEHPDSGYVPILRGEIQALREEMGGYIGAVNRKLDEVRTSLHALENHPEEGIRDLVEHVAQQKLDGVLARLEELERRQPAEAGAPGLTWDAIAERVDAQARAALAEAMRRQHAFTGGVPAAGGGGGAVGGVHRKVLEVMKSVDRLAKDRQMEEGRQRWTYRGIDDAMDAVGRAMREIGLVYTTKIVDREVSRDEATNSSGRTMLWTSVLLTVEYTFIDPDDGSRQTFQMAGEGRASDDKATSKAAAMALKYGLLHSLMVPVSGMPDGDTESPQVQRETAPRPQATQPPAAQHSPRAQAEQVTDRPAKTREQRAMDAVTAVQNLHRHPVEKRAGVLDAIDKLAQQEGLLALEVTGRDGTATVQHFIDSARATLPAGQAF